VSFGLDVNILLYLPQNEAILVLFPVGKPHPRVETPELQALLAVRTFRQQKLHHCLGG